MLSINKSFLYGISVASITWIISFYLYLQLTSYPNDESHGTTFRRNEIFSTTSPLMNKIKTSLENTHNHDVEELGLVKTTQDLKTKAEGYKKHAYNTLISDKLSLDRDVPDTRNALCRNQTYSENLPQTSVIICFYNEHFRTLLRTIHSVSNRSPKHLLAEIILVDDFSDLSDLQANLTAYLAANKRLNVKLYRTERREGLIRARLFGVRRASAEVLVFLDSHVEVNVGWLEPLLHRIKEDRRNVVTPIIDIISADSLSYASSPLVRGGFNWGLHFKWENVPKGTLATKEDFIKPIKSPTMAGGLFAINREYFIEMGEYDAGMNIWGGENLEISFRMWMCGGRLEIVPCSRVGHIFRHRRPYGAPDGQDTMLYNSLRVAHVWLDDYKKYFLRQHKKTVNYGDIQSRLQLRKELKCHDFDWYIKNVYPELTLPTDDEERLKSKWAALEPEKFQPWHSRKRNYTKQFQIRLKNSTLCMQSEKDVKTKRAHLVLKSCLRNKAQQWYGTDRNELVLAQLLCLQCETPRPVMYKCHEMGGNQEWKFKAGQSTPIYNIGAGTCLGVDKKEINAKIVMEICSNNDLMSWQLVS